MAHAIQPSPRRPARPRPGRPRPPHAGAATAATGGLTQKPGTADCISDDGSGGACTDGVALNIPDSVVVSPDGKNAYAASFGSDAVAVLDRDATTGKLALGQAEALELFPEHSIYETVYQRV